MGNINLTVGIISYNQADFFKSFLLSAHTPYILLSINSSIKLRHQHSSSPLPISSLGTVKIDVECNRKP